MQGVPAHILTILDRLHAESLHQEDKLTRADYASQTIHEAMRDKFIALEQEKAQYVYTLCRAMGARTIVEAGTSYGVSTIYLALAAAANAAAHGGEKRRARVIATEHEASKAVRAREYWAECGKVVTDVVELREGDLLETLKDDVEDVDFLLLDSKLLLFILTGHMSKKTWGKYIKLTNNLTPLVWTPMALPTLKLVQPKMRHGAVVITDNTIGAAEGYKEFLAYIRSPESGFINLTMPYNQGLEMSVYLP